MNKYKRTAPHLRSKDGIHTCYPGHDCMERWTVGHHLAEALADVGVLKSLSESEDCYYLCDYQEEIKNIIHHVRLAWDKSK